MISIKKALQKIAEKLRSEEATHTIYAYVGNDEGRQLTDTTHNYVSLMTSYTGTPRYNEEYFELVQTSLPLQTDPAYSYTCVGFRVKKDIDACYIAATERALSTSTGTTKCSTWPRVFLYRNNEIIMRSLGEGSQAESGERTGGFTHTITALKAGDIVYGAFYKYSPGHLFTIEIANLLIIKI